MNLRKGLLFFVSILIASGVVLSGCATDSSNTNSSKMEKTEAGYALCEPLIKALTKYKYQNGYYPTGLEDLVPEYIESVPTHFNSASVWYEKADETYTLSFSYQSPQAVQCSYDPTAKWKCD